MSKTLILYVEFIKKLILFAPRFFFRKFINVGERFLREGGEGNSLKRPYVESGTYKRNRDEQGREGGQRLEILSERTF